MSPPLAIVTAADNWFSAHLISALLSHKFRVIGIKSVIPAQTNNLASFSENRKFSLLNSPSDLDLSQIKSASSPSYVFIASWISVPYSLSLSPAEISQALQSDLQLINHLTDSPSQITLLLPYSSYPNRYLPKCYPAFANLTQLLLDLPESSPVHSSVVYLQDLYGPGIELSSAHPYSQIFSQLVFPSHLRLSGASQLKLSPLFITDALSGIFKITLSAHHHQTFLLSGSHSLTPLALAHQFKTLTSQPLKFSLSSPPSFSHKPFPSPPPLIPSWFKPSVSVSAGLTHIFHWLKPRLAPMPQKDLLINLSLPIPSPPVVRPPSKLSSFFSSIFSPSLKFLTSLSPLLLFSRLRLRRSLSSGLPPALIFPSPDSRVGDSSTPTRHFLSFPSLRLLFSGLLFTLAFVLIAFAFFVYQAQSQLRSSFHALLSGDFSSAHHSARLASSRLQLLNYPLLIISTVSDPLFNPPLYSYYLSALSTSEVFSQFALSGQSFSQFSASTLDPQTSPSPLEIFPQLYSRTNQSLQDLSYLQATIPATPPPFIPPKSWQHYITQLQTARAQLSLTHDFFSFYPRLAGVNQPQIYLILLQNNRELRPTGGFIGSFILATLNQGQLTDLQVYDVYDADGQLQGHVDPPLPIKDYLGEAGWFLRDANWDPDFPTSAKKISWFLDKELHTQVDGVLALDVTFLESLLKITGPVNLPDYQDTVTVDNLYLLTQERAESDFFPGSHAKKNYLAALTAAILHQFTSDSRLSWLAIMQAVDQGLSQKHLLISSFDPQLAPRLARLNWDGHLPSLAVGSLASSQVLGSTSSQISDQLFIVEANLGVNKANHFISRQLSHTIDLTSEQSILETLTLQYQNSSQPQSWPGGPYKNYLRLYLPLHAQISSVTVEDPLTRRSQILSSSDLDLSVEHAQQVIGLFFVVPPDSRRFVNVSYTLPYQSHLASDSQSPSGKANDFTYQLALIKQPGTLADPYQLTFLHPESLIPASSSPQLTPAASSGLTATGKLTYNTTLSTDQTLSVNFISRLSTKL